MDCLASARIGCVYLICPGAAVTHQPRLPGPSALRADSFFKRVQVDRVTPRYPLRLRHNSGGGSKKPHRLMEWLVRPLRWSNDRASMVAPNVSKPLGLRSR